MSLRAWGIGGALGSSSPLRTVPPIELRWEPPCAPHAPSPRMLRFFLPGQFINSAGGSEKRGEPGVQRTSGWNWTRVSRSGMSTAAALLEVMLIVQSRGKGSVPMVRAPGLRQQWSRPHCASLPHQPWSTKGVGGSVGAVAMK